MLRLDGALDFVNSDGTVAPICLPKPTHHVAGDVTITGWGRTKEGAYAFLSSPEFLDISQDERDSGHGTVVLGGNTSRVLNSVTVPVISDTMCRVYLSRGIVAILFAPYDGSSMFCAGRFRGGADSCQGDSGGPAIQTVDGESESSRKMDSSLNHVESFLKVEGWRRKSNSRGNRVLGLRVRSHDVARSLCRSFEIPRLHRRALESSRKRSTSTVSQKKLLYLIDRFRRTRPFSHLKETSVRSQGRTYCRGSEDWCFKN